MSNNLGITTNDFENICRTCLSRDSLNPLYEKHFAEMLMACTAVKFAEYDGLPAKICTNCIHEINQAFSFAKHCERIDKYLRNCLIKLETQVGNNSSYFKKEEIISPIIYRADKEVLVDYNSIEEIQEEEDVKMEFEENVIEVVGDTKTEIAYDETCEDPVRESNEKEDDDDVQSFRNRDRCTNSQTEGKKFNDGERENYEDPESDENYNQDKTCSEKPDNPGSRQNTTNLQMSDNGGIEKVDNSGSQRRCTISQIEKNTLKDDDRETNDKSEDENYEKENGDENQDETYFENPDNPDSRLKCKTIKPQIKEGSAKNEMSQHKYKISNQMYQCKTCEKSFSRFKYLKNHHKRMHTERKPHNSSNQMYKCETCEKSFKLLLNLKRHQKLMHTGMKPPPCEVCGKTLNQWHNLKRHMRIHTGERPYTCELCSKSFIQKVSLQIHMRTHTGKKPYTCEICSKSYREKSVLKVHMRIHTGEKPYMCEVSGEKLYMCEVCSKSFRKNAQLQIHMRIHTGKKPYTCKVCSKAFAQYSGLQQHMRIHTGEKPYTCDICSKGFIQSTHLKSHMRIHRKEKPYTCKLCSKKFTNTSNLRNHMRVHTGEKPYTCDVCNKQCSHASNLRVHMRIHSKV